jgi:hypothetical protein
MSSESILATYFPLEIASPRLNEAVAPIFLSFSKTIILESLEA